MPVEPAARAPMTPEELAADFGSEPSPDYTAIRLRYALAYARHGYMIVQTVGKTPVQKKWTEIATSDPEEIRAMFSKRPALNFGIVPPRGVCILDIDNKPPKKEQDKRGEESLTRLTNGATIDSPLISLSGSGFNSRHIHFRCNPARELARAPGNIRATGPDGKKITISGGMEIIKSGAHVAIAPGSIHPDTQQPYMFLDGHDIEAFNGVESLPDAPEWFYAPARPERKPYNGKAEISETENKRANAYLGKLIQGAANDLATCSKRNSTLFEKAAHLGNYAEYGVYTQEQAWQALRGACVSNGEIQEQGEHACYASFCSGWETGLGDQRSIPDDNRQPKWKHMGGGARSQAAGDGAAHDPRDDQAGDPGNDGGEALQFYDFSPTFSMSDRGLYYSEPEAKKEQDEGETPKKKPKGPKPPSWISAPFEILGNTRDPGQENWGKLIRWRDPDGVQKQMSIAQIHMKANSPAFNQALDRGLKMSVHPTQQNLLAQYLMRVEVPHSLRCVPSLGWYRPLLDWDGASFVTDAKVFGPDLGETVVYQPKEIANQRTVISGTLEQWQENIGKYAVGNSRLAFLISAAFVGPLLHLIGADCLAVHIIGKSSIGKSTAARVAQSAAGCPWNTWRVTDNALETIAAAANDGLLILDEMSQVDAKVAGRIAYMIGNGAGKARMGRDGQGKAIHTWRNVLVSTGEIGLAAKLNEAGVMIQAGQTVRMIEIPADAGKGFGLFETLHDRTNANDLSEHLGRSAKEFAGTALATFLGVYVPQAAALADNIRAAQDEWKAENLPADADPQVMRVAAHFALIAVAGAMATAAEILPWQPNEASQAAAVCFKAWLEMRGGTGAHETVNGAAAVRRYIEQFGESKFDDPWAAKVTNKHDEELPGRVAPFRAGWREQVDGAWHYYVPPETWKAELCKGFNPGAVADALIEAGDMRGIAGANATRQILKRIPGHGENSKRVYHLLPSILDGGEP